MRHTASAAALLAAAAAPLAAAQLTVTVNDTVPVRLASPFLAFNIDTASLFHSVDLADPVLINLMYALANGDSLVRFGGTAAESSFYVPDAPSPAGAGNATLISDALLEQLFAFSGQTHHAVLLDFNSLSFRERRGNGVLGPWDASNASALLARLSATHGGRGGVDWSWSIGNEPDLWPAADGQANFTQLALDTVALAAALRANFSVGTAVYGPSLAKLDTVPVQEFLTGIGRSGALAGLTVHAYPLGRDCTVVAYLNASHVGHLGTELAALAALKATLGHGGTPLVLEETAGSYGGGCENITDRFVSGFSYLQTLVVAAASGAGRVHRQDVVGWSGIGEPSHYQLAGPPGWTSGSALLTPHPDWYTSVLFKQMTSTSFLASNLTSSAGPSDPLLAQVTVGAWCSGAAWWDEQAVVLVYANPSGADVTLTVAASNLTAAPRREFLMTSSAAEYAAFTARVATGALATTAAPRAPPPSLQDDAAYLNGALLAVDDNGVLPWPNGAWDAGRLVTDPAAPLVLPAYSYGFVEYPAPADGSTIRAC